MATAVIFGGTGFIGSFFALQLLRDERVSKVVLVDIKPICTDRFSHLLKTDVDSGAIEYRTCDVRQSILEQLGEVEGVSLVANFAAIHREPGHETSEYYKTNLLGAENVCNWSAGMGCNDIIFTSSIAPYGLGEEARSESSVPAPVSAYGGSKLAAEKIHLAWKAGASARRLTIVRPGVVFGPGEGGNVSRLIKATIKGYFFYMGNEDTRKAGTYVKELTRAMLWVHDKSNSTGVSLFNMTMAPAPSMSDYVNTILSVSGKNKKILTVPFWLLYPVSFFVEAIARVVGVNQPISPVRLKKLVRSNYIVPQFLIDNDYEYKYTLNSALTEWKKIAPEEWLQS